MIEELAQARRILRDDGYWKDGGLSGVLRAASIYMRRQYYNYSNGANYNERGDDIFEEDWDNLIILDACRFDYFKEYSSVSGQLESRISRGSMSKEFIWGNFEDRQLYDTVYFSDNAWFGKLHERINADLFHFSLCERDAFDGLVAHPSTLTESAREYASEYPDKRLIVHYLQPHAPYFDTDGRERFRWPSEDHSDCDPKELQEAYVTNLKLVLSEATTLAEALTGKTVLTSDHGELLGERFLPIPIRLYQHPPGFYVDELVQVPWLTIDGDERKDIVAEKKPNNQGYEDLESDQIDDQLKALGYR